MRRRFFEIFARYSLSEPSLISQSVTVAAYIQSDAWLLALKNYLSANLDYLQEVFIEMPRFKVIQTEATFLLWIDCRGLEMDDGTLQAWFVKEASLGLNPGFSFGKGGSGFMRLNFAVPRSTLVQAMKQLKKAYDALS